MACRPTGTKPLSEPTLEYCFNEVTIARQIGHFLSVAAHWPQQARWPHGRSTLFTPAVEHILQGAILQ